MLILNETILTIHDAARLLPSNRAGKPVNFSTVLRWILRGVKNPIGQLVRLEGARIGGRWLTSKQALERFALALTPQTDDADPIRTPSAREKASDVAKKRLEKMGI
jgi:hypothetical protein